MITSVDNQEIISLEIKKASAQRRGFFYDHKVPIVGCL